MGPAFAATTTVEVTDPNGGEQLNRVGNNPYTISFTITSDDNSFLVDLNYSNSNTQGTGTPIITDVNTLSSTITCADTNFDISPVTCTYSWSTTNVGNGDYYILADVNAPVAAETDFDPSDATFNVDSFYVATYESGDLDNVTIDLVGTFLAVIVDNIVILVTLAILLIVVLRSKQITSMIMGFVRR